MWIKLSDNLIKFDEVILVRPSSKGNEISENENSVLHFKNGEYFGVKETIEQIEVEVLRRSMKAWVPDVGK